MLWSVTKATGSGLVLRMGWLGVPGGEGAPRDRWGVRMLPAGWGQGSRGAVSPENLKVEGWGGGVSVGGGLGSGCRGIREVRGLLEMGEDG